jgi:hypothetical protein
MGGKRNRVTKRGLDWSIVQRLSILPEDIEHDVMKMHWQLQFNECLNTLPKTHFENGGITVMYRTPVRMRALRLGRHSTLDDGVFFEYVVERVDMGGYIRGYMTMSPVTNL